MKKIIAVFFVATSLLFACKSSKDASKTVEKESVSASMEKWIIASKQVKCDATSEALCFQVKKQGSYDYENMNVMIENFKYEPGYKYQIELKVIPSKKADTRYVLVKEIHKIASK